MKLLILNYHGIEVREGEYGASLAEREYFILKKSFRIHLEILRKEKFMSLGISELSEMRTVDSNRSVMITFDDGHISNYEHVLPLLKEFGMKAIFFIPVNLIGSPGYMDGAQIRELGSNGFDIGSHGLNHIPLTRLRNEKLKEELLGSKKALEDLLGKRVDSFSVPRGFYNVRVRLAAKEAGYRFVFTSRFGLNVAEPDCLALSRIAVKAGTSEEEFADWIFGKFGLKAFVESIKDAVRSALPPDLYDTAAETKRIVFGAGSKN